jgi:hypothetical protein
MLAFKTGHRGTYIGLSMLSYDIKWNEHELKNKITEYENRFLEAFNRIMKLNVLLTVHHSVSG